MMIVLKGEKTPENRGKSVRFWLVYVKEVWGIKFKR